MTPLLRFDNLQAIFHHSIAHWPDHRTPRPNTRYTLQDAALGAFGLFLTQAPSFLASQRRLGRVPAGCGYCCGTSPHPSERDQSAGDHHSKLVFKTPSTPLALPLSTLCPSTIRSSTHARF